MGYLNLDQSAGELNDLWGERDYYHYLRSEAFVEAFLKPIAAIVNRLGGPVLDVGCGEAALADHVTVPYLGIDGSESAIRRSMARHRLGVWTWPGRIESPPRLPGVFPTAVFGGILEVLVKPEHRVPLLEMYRERFGVRYFIVYDLERLDTSALDLHYGLPVKEIHASADPRKMERVIDHEVKLHRKILVYKAGG